jgi:hypothetical protein
MTDVDLGRKRARCAIHQEVTVPYCRVYTSFVVVAVPLAIGACIPYTVATTARPAPVGERQRSTVMYTVPNGLESKTDSGKKVGVSLPGSDIETRWGLDEKSDVGIRIPSMSGFVMSYKRQLAGVGKPDRLATAFMVGGGFVNWGQHGYLDATFLATGAERIATPYGGLRVMQTIPLSSSAVSDRPTAGAFFGVRIGDTGVSISPELGVFYDHSALGLRSREVVVVPAISVRNLRLGFPKPFTRPGKAKRPERIRPF